MALPYVIEYLLSLRTPSGKGSLVHQGGSQTEIPIVPPNTQFVLEVFPFGSDYFDIVYASWIDPSVVPGAFYGWGSYFGSRTAEGNLITGMTTYPLDSFVFISESEPAQALIRNNTALNQYYAGVAYYISIASEGDYDLVIKALEGVGASETNRLLERLVTGVPRPPIEEGS